ncbi:uncharacterized protein V6R79_004060 [Siganus canaliculatus]
MEEADWVDSNRANLIQTITAVLPIADKMVEENIIHNETYNRIRAEKTSQDQMRELYHHLRTTTTKSAFYRILHNIQPSIFETEDSINKVLKTHKDSLREKFEYEFEGTEVDHKDKKALDQIYTELQIIQGESEIVNNEHEIWEVEDKSRCQGFVGTTIKCNDIFNRGSGRAIRKVMTKGIAGIGKTVSVKKFILDWANGKTNTQLDFIFVLPFRELNLVDNDQLSLETLVKDFHLELKNIAVSRIFANHKILFIFDGLDESQLELNFKKAKRLTDPTKESSVDTIVTNLIREHLLPSALVWITSRPGAVQRIPREYVHQMTEVTGFKDEQKKEYFMKRFNDQIVAQKIVEIITTSRSLFIMCHIPIFCWIASKVLAHLLEAKQDNTQNETTELPTTLTEMYTYFLSIHLQKETEKYNNQEETDEDIFTCNKDFILKLGRMAFESLKEQKLIFNANDLKSYSLDVQKAGIYCGLCTEILKQENPVQKKKKFYCFVHLTVQEYFAALFVYNCFATKTIDSLSLKDFLLDGSEEELKSTLDAHPVDLPLDELIEISIANSTSRKTGELDMFLRFLIGLSLQKTQELLQGLIQQTENHSSVVEEIKSSLRDIDLMDCSPERCLNLVHCWLELKDSSLQQDLQEFLKPNHSQETPLTPVLCSVLAYTLLISKEPLDEFNLQKYKPSHRGIFRLIPAVRNCRKAMGVESLIDGLMNSECKLEGLSLSGYGLEAEEELADVVKSLIPSLKELELSGYITRGRIYSVLSDGLGSLEKLRLNQNGMITGICKELVTSFTSNPCFLQELELSYTTFKDSEMEILCTGLMSTNCHLKMLRVNSLLSNEPQGQTAAPASSEYQIVKAVLKRMRSDDSQDGFLELTEIRRTPDTNSEHFWIFRECASQNEQHGAD